MARIPDRSTTAGRVFNDLRNLARRQGRGTDELLVRYTMERWLYRLSISDYAEAFVLKGAMLLAVFDARRPTRDADLLVRGIKDDHVALVTSVTQIASIDLDDGVVFEANQTRMSAIREENSYVGTRITMAATVGRAQTKLSLDLNVGDPVSPGVVLTEYPQLLSTSTFQLRTYPIETVLAEKITACIELELGNTRERDYADIWRITRNQCIDGTRLVTALRATVDYRGLGFLSLGTFVEELAKIRQSAYTAWLRRQATDNREYPTEYLDVVREVSAFADPVINGNADSRYWNATERRWQPEKPHQPLA